MITTYLLQSGKLLADANGSVQDALWVDLFDPTADEEHRVEEVLHVQIPTRAEMREVESSSNLYHEDHGTFVTVRAVVRTPDEQPRLSSITLVRTETMLVTVRYGSPKAFTEFVARVGKESSAITTSMSAMLCFLETLVDRDADILEEIGDALDPVSREIFSQNAGAMKSIAAADLGRVLKQIGQSGDLASRVRESLHSVGRAVPFLAAELHEDRALHVRLKTLGTDVQSLLEHDNFMQTQIQFLLDSNLGLISIQQNAIMKTLSVAAVVFLPPTLIGSIYGMNFEKMPELHWHLGYLYALGLMVLSAIGPLLYFRWKRWL
ncbi:magnesium transporter CorA family protein [Terriglobus sp.]|uniref:magnesium transporter CorA family protein n=1 Tax=Terriglobus sp. TaxID=1889013 RepID=UPI003B00A1F5